MDYIKARATALESLITNQVASAAAAGDEPEVSAKKSLCTNLRKATKQNQMAPRTSNINILDPNLLCWLKKKKKNCL